MCAMFARSARKRHSMTPQLVAALITFRFSCDIAKITRGVFLPEKKRRFRALVKNSFVTPRFPLFPSPPFSHTLDSRAIYIHSRSRINSFYASERSQLVGDSADISFRVLFRFGAFYLTRVTIVIHARATIAQRAVSL